MGYWAGVTYYESYGATTLYAVWGETVTITYDANGGEFGDDKNINDEGMKQVEELAGSEVWVGA